MTTSNGFHLRVRQILTALIAISILVAFTSIAHAAPLHDAAKAGNIKKVKRLLDKGANVNAKAKYGATPLYYAAKNWHTETVRLLVKRGGTFDAKSDSGETLMHSAASKGHTKIVKLLIESGATVDAKKYNGETLMHSAASEGNTETVEFLIKRGANVKAKDKYGNTPLHYAAHGGHTGTVEVLIKRGAKVNAKTKHGETPLHSAAYSGHTETVEFLIKRGAVVKAKDKYGKTAYDIALRRKKTETAAIIMSVMDGTYIATAQKPTAPPNITASIKFSEPSGNKILDAEETGTLTVKVSNRGKGAAYGVVVKLTPNKNLKGLSYPKSVKIGTVPAGKAIRARVKLTAANSIPTSKVSFNIEATEANGFDADPISFAFSTQAFAPPKLVIADMAIDDLNGNSKVEPGEMVTITLRVQNVGHGNADEVIVYVRKGKNVYMGEDSKTRFKLGSLPSGQHKDVSFMFYTNKKIKNGVRIPINIKLSESRGIYGSSKPLALAMNARQKSIKEFVVKGNSTAPTGAIALAGGLSVDVDQGLPKTAMKNRNAVAVVIGNSDYQKTKGVEFAINDARAIKRYLIEVLGYREGNILYKTNATKGDFEYYFGNKDTHEGRLFDLIKPGKSDVFIYYSGHGAPGLNDAKGYFVPVEAAPNRMELTGYSADTFYNNLAKLKARSMTVVLDACFSGAEILQNISPMVVEIDNPTLKMKNAVVLSSSKGSQVSSWYNEKKHGMFTYFFLKAIHDRNADINNDKKLTYGEIYKFVSDESEGVPYYARSVHSVKQTPTIEGKFKGKVLVKYK